MVAENYKILNPPYGSDLDRQYRPRCNLIRPAMVLAFDGSWKKRDRKKGRKIFVIKSGS